MTVLDAIHLTLVPEHNYNDENSFAGRIRSVTLQYITRSKGVEACYVSKQVVNQTAWIFLIHEGTQSHKYFLESTIGVGIMMPFLQSPPRLYTFSGGPFDFLIDNASLDLSIFDFDLKPSATDVTKFGTALSDFWSPQTVFFAPQDDEDAASFLALTMETKSLAPATRDNSVAPRYTVQHQIVGVDRFEAGANSNTPTLALPTTAADMLRSDPRLYGNVSFDESEMGFTAQAQNISFRPMEYIADSDWFSRDENDLSSVDFQDNCLSILTLHYTQEHSVEHIPDFHAVCRGFSIQPGLLSLRWCIDEHDTRIVRFIAMWNRGSDYKNFELAIVNNDLSLVDRTYLELDPTFSVFPMQGLPNWDDSLIVELITFEFAKRLSQAEKTAFEWYLNKFLANMEPSDPDELSVAQPDKPLWSLIGPQEHCIVFINWNGFLERKAWLRNFLAQPYDLAGYLVHAISVSGAAIASTTVTLHTVDHFKIKYEKEQKEDKANTEA